MKSSYRQALNERNFALGYIGAVERNTALESVHSCLDSTRPRSWRWCTRFEGTVGTSGKVLPRNIRDGGFPLRFDYSSWPVRTTEPVSSSDLRLDRICGQPPETARINSEPSRSILWLTVSLVASPAGSISITQSDQPSALYSDLNSFRQRRAKRLAGSNSKTSPASAIWKVACQARRGRKLWLSRWSWSWFQERVCLEPGKPKFSGWGLGFFFVKVLLCGALRDEHR